jgi:hypothetical protein
MCPFYFYRSYDCLPAQQLSFWSLYVNFCAVSLVMSRQSSYRSHVQISEQHSVQRVRLLANKQTSPDWQLLNVLPRDGVNRSLPWPDLMNSSEQGITSQSSEFKCWFYFWKLNQIVDARLFFSNEEMFAPRERGNRWGFAVSPRSRKREEPVSITNDASHL